MFSCHAVLLSFAVVHVFVCSCCCYVCTAAAIYCRDQAVRLVKPFATPCQLLNCLNYRTPYLSPFLSKLSFVGVTLLRCTSVTIMAMDAGRMEVDNGTTIPDEYLG